MKKTIYVIITLALVLSCKKKAMKERLYPDCIYQYSTEAWLKVGDSIRMQQCMSIRDSAYGGAPAGPTDTASIKYIGQSISNEYRLAVHRTAINGYGAVYSRNDSFSIKRGFINGDYFFKYQVANVTDSSVLVKFSYNE